MAKKRVYELAQELEITSKEFIERANALGYTWIRSHANSLENSEASELKRKISMGGGQPKPKKKTVLRRRAVRAQSPSESGSKEEYQVIVTRLSDAGEKVIERKRIEVPVPPSIPTFSTPVQTSVSEKVVSQSNDTATPNAVPVSVETSAETTQTVETAAPRGEVVSTPVVVDTSKPVETKTEDTLTQQQTEASTESEKVETSVTESSSDASDKESSVASTETHQAKVSDVESGAEDTAGKEQENTSTQTASKEKEPVVETSASKKESEHVVSEAKTSESTTETASNTTDAADVTENKASSASIAEPTHTTAESTTSAAESTDVQSVEVKEEASNPAPSTEAKATQSEQSKAQGEVETSSAPEQTTESITTPDTPKANASDKPESTVAEPSMVEISASQKSTTKNTVTKQKSSKASKKSKHKKQTEAVRPPIQMGSKFEESKLLEDKYRNLETIPVDTPRDEPDIRLPEDRQAELAEKAAYTKNINSTRSSNTNVRANDSRKKSKYSKSDDKKTDRKKGGKRSFEPGGKPQGDNRRRKNRKHQGRKQKNQAPVTMPMSEKKRVVKVDEAITVGALAHEMAVKSSELIRKLLSQGIMATINQTLSVEEATSLAKLFGYEVQDVGFDITTHIPTQDIADSDVDMLPRPPVVTVMGHVDHGKTSLLDAIRKTSIAAREAGGITQHIGASVVRRKDGNQIVFLDTPGHEAFTSMRSRGAQATDIVILVVAADDGIMPQTIEAINHAKAADVPIIVAINKIDKAGADSARVRYSLTQHDLVAEDFGGDILMVDVSAHTGEGLDKLLEDVLLQAEIMELKANPNKAGHGIVIESHIEKGRGPVSTVLVSEGTVRAGDIIVAGTHFGRLRAMFDDQKRSTKEAGPSIPVKVLGLSGTPNPGDRFDCVADEKAAKQIIEHRKLQRQREEQAKLNKRAVVFGFNDQKEINIIIKADTQGTLEALKQSLLQLKHDEIELSIPHAAVGGITENDINLASTTNSAVFGFHVRADNKAQQAADSEGVQIRIYRVIYELIDAAKRMMEEQLSPVLQEKPIGQAEIRKTFNIPRAGRVAGCYVTEGKVTRGALIRLYREDIQIYEGKVSTLRRFKDDVKEVAQGFECGIQIEGYQDIRPGDMIEAYEIEEIAQTLNI